MVNVIVAGVPKTVKLSKFLGFLKKMIYKSPYKEFHVNYVKVSENPTLKEISFYMTSNDGRTARRLINNCDYIHENIPYHLECWVEGKGNAQYVEDIHNKDVVYEEYEPPRKSRRYANSPVRSRSHSPYHSKELKEIELKIELVRKQRILMEEETKLLIEKKKMEYVQNFGSNDYTKLVQLEEICRRNDANEIPDIAELGQSSKTVPKMPSVKLPQFLGPCKEITHQMQALIKGHKDIKSKNRSLLWNLLRSAIKKRIAVVLEGKGYLPTKGIVALYRAEHPRSTDILLLDELCNTISTSRWPHTEKENNLKKEPENPGAGAAEVVLKLKNESLDSSQIVDLDDFVDMENDVENWGEDEVVQSEVVKDGGITEANDKDTENSETNRKNEVSEANTADAEVGNVDDKTESVIENSNDKGDGADDLIVAEDKAKQVSGGEEDVQVSKENTV